MSSLGGLSAASSAALSAGASHVEGVHVACTAMYEQPGAVRRSGRRLPEKYVSRGERQTWGGGEGERRAGEEAY